jgi:hypothetical protein
MQHVLVMSRTVPSLPTIAHALRTFHAKRGSTAVGLQVPSEPPGVAAPWTQRRTSCSRSTTCTLRRRHRECGSTHMQGKRKRSAAPWLLRFSCRSGTSTPPRCDAHTCVHQPRSSSAPVRHGSVHYRRRMAHACHASMRAPVNRCVQGVPAHDGPHALGCAHHDEVARRKADQARQVRNLRRAGGVSGVRRSSSGNARARASTHAPSPERTRCGGSGCCAASRRRSQTA